MKGEGEGNDSGGQRGQEGDRGEGEEGTGEALWGAVVGEGGGNLSREPLEQLQGTGGERVEDEEGTAASGERNAGEKGNNSRRLVRDGTVSRGVWGRFRGT